MDMKYSVLSKPVLSALVSIFLLIFAPLFLSTTSVSADTERRMMRPEPTPSKVVPTPTPSTSKGYSVDEITAEQALNESLLPPKVVHVGMVNARAVYLPRPR